MLSCHYARAAKVSYLKSLESSSATIDIFEPGDARDNAHATTA